jgi:hypothetical protein
LDFTGITREDMLVRLQKLANQVNPEWDDFSVAHPENLLLESMAFIADLIRGTMEERTRQLNWATITDRLAAIRLGRLSGFQLPGATASTLSGVFTTASGQAPTTRIPIPEGTRVRTDDPTDPKRYQVTSDNAAIETTGASATVSLEQSETVVEQFQSNNEPNQELLLSESPYIDDSMEVEAADGTYSAYSTFLGASATTKAFVIFVDDQGRARARFGNGINGSIPQGEIEVTYRVGGGVAGEVSAGASWTIEDTISDELGQPVQLILTNTSASQPASDAMTVAEARVRGPLSVRTINRVVNEEDFEFVATQIPGIARAFMATSNTSTDIAEDHGRLEIVAFGTRLDSGRYEPATPSGAKLIEIAAKLSKEGNFPPVMGFTYGVYAAPFRTVDVVVRIFKEANATATAVGKAIRAALADFFAVAFADRTPNTSIDFGAKLLGSDGLSDYTIGWSNVFDAVTATEGVRRISPLSNNLLLNNTHGSVILTPREFPELGTVTILDEDQAGKQI